MMNLAVPEIVPMIERYFTLHIIAKGEMSL